MIRHQIGHVYLLESLKIIFQAPLLFLIYMEDIVKHTECSTTLACIIEPRHEISINVVCATSQKLRSACAYAQSGQSICQSHEYFISVKLLNEHHLEFLSLKGRCTGSSESTLVKMPHCWKSHGVAHIRVDCPLQAGQSLNVDINTISKWADSWLVTFNQSKTLSISRKRIFFWRCDNR